MKNKIATNGIYNHLKHNRKHKFAWDNAVYWRRFYIHGRDAYASEKRTKIMNLEKGVTTNSCWTMNNTQALVYDLFF